MNVYLPNLRLPSAYQEVEYIRTSGTQYINTLVSTNGRDNTEIETDLRYYNNVSGSSQVNGKDNRYWFFIGVNSSNVFYAGAGGIRGASGVTNDRNKHNFKIKTSETNLYIDGTVYALPSNTGMDDTTGYIGIGAASRPNDGGGFYWKCVEDIFSFKIKQGGTLVRDMVPCYRKSDSVIGMYDLVNSVFYTNSGTGTFSKGNDVTMTELQNAYIGEYIEEITETYSLSLAGGSGSTTTTTSIYKAGYKITKVVMEGQVPINSSNSGRSHIGINSDSGAYGTDVDCYLGYNYGAMSRTGDFKVASNGSNIKTQALGAWGGGSGTLTEYQEITEEGYTLTFNGGTLSGTWNTTEANAIHTIFTSSTAIFGISKNNTNGHTATITVTYEPN